MRRSVCSTMSTRNQMFLIYRKMLETDADPPLLRAKLHTLSAKKLTERREFVRHNDANISNLIKLRKKETFRLNSPIAAIQDPSIVQSIDSSTFSKTMQQTILEATTIPKTPSSSVYSHIHTLKKFIAPASPYKPRAPASFSKIQAWTWLRRTLRALLRMLPFLVQL